MLTVEAGKYDLWEKFSVILKQKLEFIPGNTYHLTGPNGSGKSSFLKKLVLPNLLSRADVYALYFQQQMNLQIQCVKAYAGIMKPRRRVRNERETVAYLLDNLQQTLLVEPRPAYILMDESFCEAQVRDFAFQHPEIVCLIYTSHETDDAGDRVVDFITQSTALSEIHATYS